MPVVTRVSELAAAGDGRLATVTYVSGGRRETLPAELLLLHQGVVPNVNLAMAAAIEIAGTIPCSSAGLAGASIHDLQYVGAKASLSLAMVPGILGGAEAAIVRGRIAARARWEALAPAAVFDVLAPMANLHKIAGSRPSAVVPSSTRCFLSLAREFRIPSSSGDTIVCRCEEVTARNSVKRSLGATGPNQLKSFLRCGMGPCQGRLCGLTVTEFIARRAASRPGGRLLSPPPAGEADHPCRTRRHAEGRGRASRPSRAQADAVSRRHRYRWRASTDARRRCTGAARHEAGARREGPRRPPRLGREAGGVRQLARHVAESRSRSARWSSGSASGNSSTTICGFERTAKCWSPRAPPNSTVSARASPS